jgi:hypothetical protein
VMRCWPVCCCMWSHRLEGKEEEGGGRLEGKGGRRGRRRDGGGGVSGVWCFA